MAQKQRLRNARGKKMWSSKESNPVQHMSGWIDKCVLWVSGLVKIFVNNSASRHRR